MKDIEFNLLDEPWVRVMTFENEVKEVSLTDALLNAHNYKSLCGEIPTQDIVLLRLMLAVLHTVFSRVDTDGNDIEEGTEKKAIALWKSLWELKKFPEKPLKEYLDKWHERFWLFHPERPFGQIAELKVGTEYDVSKLNGEISESSNKKRIFSSYSGNEKNTLSYSQAARWLLYLNAYDDTSAKPTKDGKEKAGGKLPSPGAGWLGQLGLIYISGNNLFETLMLNFVLKNKDILQINSEEDENIQNPLWEREKAPYKERVEISRPENLAELYTLQSRRIHLNRNDNNEVINYILIGGDFFSKENAFIEPMTVWRVPKKDGEAYTPKRHDPSKQMWREFSSLYDSVDKEKDKDSRAGVIQWYNNCCCKVFEKDDTVNTKIVSVQYGDKDFFVNHVFSDNLSMNTQLLSEVGAAMRKSIQSEIEKCDELAKAVGNFARHLYVASGGTTGDMKNPDKGYDGAGKNAMAQLYYRLDIPFREWLLSVDVTIESIEYYDDKIKEWQETAKKIACDYVEELAENAGEKTITGHFLDEKLYCLPKARIFFKGRLKKIFSEA